MTVSLRRVTILSFRLIEDVYGPSDRKKEQLYSLLAHATARLVKMRAVQIMDLLICGRAFFYAVSMNAVNDHEAITYQDIA